MWISLGSELFRCGKLRERMTKEQSNGVVPENLEQEKVHHLTERFIRTSRRGSSL